MGRCAYRTRGRSSARARAGARWRGAARSSAPTFSVRRVSLRRSYFVGQSYLLEDAVAEGEVAGRAEVAGVGDVDVDDLLDAGGAGVEDDDAVGELDGLVDVVGDEDDGLALGVPDAEQLAAHDEAGEG